MALPFFFAKRGLKGLKGFKALKDLRDLRDPKDPKAPKALKNLSKFKEQTRQKIVLYSGTQYAEYKINNLWMLQNLRENCWKSNRSFTASHTN